MNLGRNGGCLPDQLFTQVNWSKYAALTALANATPFDQIRLMSLYDPIYATGGDQPTGFNEFKTFYQNYRVTGISYRLMVENTTSSEAINVAMSASGTPWTGTQNRDQLTRGRRNVIRYISAPGGNPASKVHFYGTIRPWAVLGMTKSQYMEDDETAGTFFGNPAKNIYLNFCTFRHDDPAGAVNNSVNIVLTMKFSVEFFRRQILPTSGT